MLKHLLKFLLVLLSFFGIAQDKVIPITPAMFDKTTDQQFLGSTDGWLFKQGNDTAWAKTDIDVSRWRKLKPTGLSAKYADKNGRVECWFRIKIKLDSTFGNKAFGLKSSTWAASDVYIDGKLVISSGNTGANGRPFEELRPFGHLPFPVNLKPGVPYTIALHFVDYLAPLPPVRLKSEDVGLISLIRLTGPRYGDYFLLINIKRPIIFNTIWISISTMLSLLFWLLYIQNPFEKNLRLIAFGSTFLALEIFCFCSYTGYNELSYAGYTFYNIANNLFTSLSFIMTLIILVNIFKRTISADLKVFLYIFFLGTNLISVLPNSTAGLLWGCLFILLIAVYIYYIVSSWKKLRGAQWAIVFGLCFSLIFILLALLFNYAIRNVFVVNLLLTGYALSFPLSLLVYVAIRFKEIIKEMQQNAGHVLQLSEEKREEALNRQKILEEEVNRQTAEIRNTLDHLKTTQTRLIQSEKMASLGELTAGIAHEIQNPLNFVNNFSEVNAELIDELKLEIAEGNYEEVNAIADDIKQNEKKINMHGKRADAIVKGMLQHSQSSSGKKEPTDINALADEYLRLSYHGLRAKDKSFNAELVTHFDADLSKINVIPQDIGRVLLNLFNNAFYSVNQKKKTAGEDYKPEVSVSTGIENGQVVIKVKDNGVGIPDVIKDKIMQPFFTTKPTGEGTGLGLSLSYDIVVKGHGGEILIDTKDGKYTTFQILLPIQN
jgi:two-component system NtrC family sensor kinase